MIDQATLQAATTKLLLDSMSPEDKDKLLTQALANILEPKRTGNSWGNDKSPLQDAFDNAARVAAGKFLTEYFEAPEVQARVKVFVTAAVERAFTEDFVKKLTDRMLQGLWSER